MQIMDGKKLSAEIKENLKKEISEKNHKPGLAVVLVGADPASVLYTNMKKKACKSCGIESFEYNLPGKTTEEELFELIDKLNNDNKINGILVQLPLPAHINKDTVLDKISPDKDVDGFHALNMGKLMQGRECFKACTPWGVIKLLEKYNIKIEGKNAVVLGRSTIVGKPMAQMLMEKNATVTVCHSRTKNIEEVTKQADIIISAIGRAHFVKENMVKEGAVVVDVGTNYIGDKLVGDVDFEKVSPKTSFITPVPGGVGPMTIATLLQNTYEAYLKSSK
ncbi:MAG: bifunctional methylenetetrahydrofolate dehydrogenase/methenyltetrahydrofolate cyclohydrolase FolD [Candidatus Muiribacteriota bacterium]